MAPAVAAYYTALAKEAGAAVKRVNPNKLRLMTGTESHQGVAAFASEIDYVTVDDLMAAEMCIRDRPKEESQPKITQDMLETSGRNKLSDLAQIIIGESYKRVMVLSLIHI